MAFGLVVFLKRHIPTCRLRYLNTGIKHPKEVWSGFSFHFGRPPSPPTPGMLHGTRMHLPGGGATVTDLHYIFHHPPWLPPVCHSLSLTPAPHHLYHCHYKCTHLTPACSYEVDFSQPVSSDLPVSSVFHFSGSLKIILWTLTYLLTAPLLSINLTVYPPSSSPVSTSVTVCCNVFKK